MNQGRMNLSLSEITQSLEEKFYVNVPFPLEPSVIEEAVQAFFKFLDEPNSVKAHIDFTIAPNHRRGDIGFKHREPDEHTYNDSKDFFHFHPDLFEKYTSFLEEYSVVDDFMQKASPIWELAYQTVGQILQTLEPDFPGVHARVFDTEHVHLMLRFLKYDWQNSGKYLAKPHFDAGSFTLAIAESCPGLRIGSCPENLRPIEHKPGNAVFMLSSNFKKVMDSEKLHAGWHDVTQLDETLIGKPFARWAVVVFVEAHGVEALPRTETHKWYKEA